MKTFIHFLVWGVCETVFALIYGFWLQHLFSFEVYLLLSFSVPFLAMTMATRDKNLKTVKSVLTKLATVAVVALVLMLFSVAVYMGGNEISGEPITGEYNVLVESVSHHGGGTAYFVDGYGERGRVELHDYRIMWTDEDDWVERGDTIRIQKYKGLFGDEYYVFIEEVH